MNTLFGIIYYIFTSGEDCEICGISKSYLVDEKFFDIFILMCNPIMKLNINYFDGNSKVKLSHVLANRFFINN